MGYIILFHFIYYILLSGIFLLTGKFINIKFGDNLNKESYYQ